MNSFGNNFRVSLFGESHGPVIGIVLDGVPAGLSLKPEDFCADLGWRSGGGRFTTSRREKDEVRILSGVLDDRSTGAPLALLIWNTDIRSADYNKFKDTPRPGHADFSASVRFGYFNDIRGGGHFSGRITAAVVAAGVVARKILASRGIGPVSASVISVGGEADCSKWRELLADAAADGDSLGAVVECTADVAAGIGEPFWNSVESMISHAVFAIPGVRGVEFGDGFAAAAMRGSVHNDAFGPDGKPVKNGCGGVNGGISNGSPIVFRVAFKPTSSISRAQNTFNFKTGEMTSLECGGRHDVCFALRTPVIVEAMAALALADLTLASPSPSRGRTTEL